MKGIPVKTDEFLKNAVRGFPRTPYAGAKAIQKFIFNNYGYGCDENVLQEKWARYPNEVKKFMTCQDAGIFNYLMAKRLGLDVVLAKFEDFNGTKQSHLGALVFGEDSHYLLSNNHLEKIVLRENQYTSIGKKITAIKVSVDDLKKSPDDLKDTFAKAKPEELSEVVDFSSFSKISFLDVADVANIIESSKGKEGFMNFFATGQMTSTYYNRMKSKEKVVYSVNRFLKINDNFMELRKSFNFGGYFINLLFTEDKLKLLFSSGVNNSLMENPVELYQADCNALNRNSIIYKDFVYVDQPEEIREKIENVWVRRRIGLLLAENFLKQKKQQNDMKQLTSVSGEGDTIIGGVYPKYQLKLAYLHAAIAFCTQNVKDETMQLYKERHGESEKKPYTYAHLMTNDYIDAQQADTNSRFFKYHKKIVDFAKDLGKEYGLKL